MANKNKFLYSGYFLDTKSKDKLVNLLGRLGVPMLLNVHMSHVTIEYGTDFLDAVHEDVECTLEVDAVVFDHSAVAFTVRGAVLSQRPVPHITASTAHGVPPAYSNTMLGSSEATVIKLDFPVKIKTTIKKIYTDDVF